MFRVGVSALIINERDELLLVNLESFEERYYAIPGGGLDEGETLEDAVYREVKEELSIPKKNLEFLGKSEMPLRFLFKKIVLARDGKEYLGQERYFFGFKLIAGEDEIVPRAGEVRDYTWATIDDLHKYLLFDNQLEDTQAKIGEVFPQLATRISSYISLQKVKREDTRG